jgi:hypothetical protein
MCPFFVFDRHRCPYLFPPTYKVKFETGNMRLADETDARSN